VRIGFLAQKQSVRTGGILIRQDFFQREDGRPTPESNKAGIVGELWNGRQKFFFSQAMLMRHSNLSQN